MSELELQDAILRHSLALLRLSAGQQGEVDDLLRQLADDLKLLLSAGNLTEGGRREVEELIAEASKAIDARYATAAGVVDTHGIALVVADRTAELIADLSPAITKPTPQTLRSLADDVLIDGSPSSAWWGKQAEDVAFRFAAQVRQGVVNGETTDRIVQRVVGKRGEPGIIDVARRHARALVHSSVLNSAALARFETFKANPRLFKGVRWLATLDMNACLQCAALDGEAWGFDHKRLAGTKVEFRLPLAHWNCFPGKTLVSVPGALTGASKRMFDGEVTIIRTAAGRNLTATPNHPILTHRGWVAAGLLNEGDRVVASRFDERAAPVRDMDGENVPSRIHDVAEAFFRSRAMLAGPMETTAEDFHGDGLDGEVAIVWSDRLLAGEANASLGEQSAELNFVVRSADVLARLARGSGLAECFQSGHLAAPSGMSEAGEALALVGACPRHARELLFAAPAHGNASAAEAANDGGARYSNPFGDTADADALIVEVDRLAQIEGHAETAGLVLRYPDHASFDRIVSVRRELFHGMVYNLETNGGWYLAQGIITHNCRCTLSAVPKTLRERGIDSDAEGVERRAADGGTLVGDTSFDAFLARMSPAQVERYLGEKRAALYRAGKITVKDLVSGTGRELTLDQLKAL